jgi:hypothetical protein
LEFLGQLRNKLLLKPHSAQWTWLATNSTHFAVQFVILWWRLYSNFVIKELEVWPNKAFHLMGTGWSFSREQTGQNVRLRTFSLIECRVLKWVEIDRRIRCLQDEMLQRKETGLYVYQWRCINQTVYSILIEDNFVMSYYMFISDVVLTKQFIQNNSRIIL